MKLKKVIEYIVNELDDEGEIADVNPHDTLAEARATEARLVERGKAVHVEKVTRWWGQDGSLERQIEEDIK